MLNASPFYYGLAGMFYTPLNALDPAPIVDSASGNKEYILWSQRPHIWVYPCSSQGGEMILPYVNTRNWLKLTVAANIAQMGRLRLLSLTNLLNANSVVGSDCDVQVYAWAENVKVCGPTYCAALQSSNKKKDWGTKGGSRSDKAPQRAASKPVSNTTTRAAKGGNLRATQSNANMESRGGTSSYSHAEKAHNEGPKWSEQASSAARTAKSAGGMAKVAGYDHIGNGLLGAGQVAAAASGILESFGYTDTPVLSEVKPYKSLPFHAFSSSEISVPNDKLTLDPGNELAMCNEALGIPDADELNIEAICGRESYIATYTWAATDASDVLIMNAKVTPNMLRYDTIATGQYRLYLTPIAQVTKMFQYWRGDIVFRFRFICSKYHRGRVRITWDPLCSLYGVSDTNTSNYNRIIDIAETPDVRIKIPYQQHTAFLHTGPALNLFEGAAGNEKSPTVGTDNGQISMRVFTQQTSPSLSADIKIVMSVYGENMEFGGPQEVPVNYSFYELQSADVDLTPYIEGDISTPLFAETFASPDTNLLYFGEYISSVKQLMRRTCRSFTTFNLNDTGSRLALLTCHINRLPLYNGFDMDGIHNADEVVGAAQSAYNFVYNVPMNWIGCCFIGNRGSVNWTFNVINKSAVSEFSVTRKPDLLTIAKYSKVTALGNIIDKSQGIQELWSATQSGLAGMSLTNTRTQTGLSVVAPMYTSHRFFGCSPSQRTLGVDYDNSDRSGIEVLAKIAPADTMNAKYVNIDGYVAIGADFAFHFFLNVPTLWYLDTLPIGNDP